MKKVLLVGCVNFGVAMNDFSVSCDNLGETLIETSKNFDEFKAQAEHVKLKQEHKHPFDKFINGKNKRK